jgi:hypothetical protein
MADITTTINGMPKKDTSPTPPDAVVKPPVVLAATKIKEIAIELAQPWQYGDALHRFAKKHGVPLAQVKEIAAALKAKQVADGGGD